MGALERPIFVSLWSVDCDKCHKELRALSKDVEKIGKSMDVLALCIDEGEAEQSKARRFLKEIKFPWKSGLPSKATNQALISVFSHTLSTLGDLPTPSGLLISKEGQIIALYHGSHPVAQIIEDSQAKKDTGRWLSKPDKINLLYLPRNLMELGTLEDTADYIYRAHAHLLAHKEYPILLVWVADEFRKRGQHKVAASYYQTAYQTGQDNPLVLNNIAWVSATHKDATMRDGALALKCAQRCVRLTEGKNPGYLDTLAAAYAETGNYKVAIAIAQKAAKLASQMNQQALIPGLKKAIALYRQGKPMRD